jgi:hypothetical protein
MINFMLDLKLCTFYWLLKTQRRRLTWKSYGLNVQGSVQILRKSNFGTSLICILQKETCNILLLAECRIYWTRLQSSERRTKLNSVTFTVRGDGSLLCCEVDGAILTSECNEMLHYRRNITETWSDDKAYAVLVFGLVIDLTGEWPYVSWFIPTKLTER